MNKKVVLTFLALFACFSSFAQGMTKAQVKQLAENCGANEEDKYIALNFEVPTTPSGKCLMSCILKLVKTINADGAYDKPAALEALKSSWPEVDVKTLEQLAAKCEEEANEFQDLSKSDTCEYGYRVALCVNKYFKNDPASHIILENQKNESA